MEERDFPLDDLDKPADLKWALEFLAFAAAGFAVLAVAVAGLWVIAAGVLLL